MKKLILVFCSIALMACSFFSTPAATDASLLHHRYDLESFNGKKITNDNAERAARIEFQEGMRISGMMCNFYNGNVTVEDGVMKATGPVVSTLMACVDPVLGQAETAFMQAVTEGAKLNLNKDKLIMTHGNNMFIFKLNDYK